MANASAALQWGIIRKNSSFLLRRNGRLYTKEANNLRGVNSFRYSGLVQDKTVGLEASADGKNIVVVTKKQKSANKPAKSQNRISLKKNNPRKAFKTIMAVTKGQGYRKDLQSAALRKASTLIRTSKNAATSTA